MAIWLLIAIAAMAPSEPTAPVAYQCLDDSKFMLTASPTLAVVRFANGEYRLPRRPSSLAIKYASKSATLYLDGDFAAFIADDRPLPGCFKVKPAEPG